MAWVQPVSYVRCSAILKRRQRLLSADATFDPFVGDNEAGFSTTLGITQFLTRTHRTATDVIGNEITALDSDDRLLEPTGLFNNRRMVGYVPARGDQLSSNNGIFTLPQAQPVVIQPPNPQAVGRGNAAYTDNVGGLIIEDAAGDLTFVPQWTRDGYRQDATTLNPGEARRIIYALVPQQAGQNLQLNQTYAVEAVGPEYRIADGGFTIISADQHPENFYQETADVYTVEDTLSDISNAATAVFNGIRGLYVEPASNTLVPTVDPDIPSLADARVGNELSLVFDGPKGLQQNHSGGRPIPWWRANRRYRQPGRQNYADSVYGGDGNRFAENEKEN